MDARRRRRAPAGSSGETSAIAGARGEVGELGQVGGLVVHDGARDALVPGAGGLRRQLGGGEVVQLLAGARGPDPLGQLEHAVERRGPAFRVAHHEDVRAGLGEGRGHLGNLGKTARANAGRNGRGARGRVRRRARGSGTIGAGGEPAGPRMGASARTPGRARACRGSEGGEAETERTVRHGCAGRSRGVRGGRMARKRGLRRPAGEAERRRSPAMPAMPVRSRSAAGGSGIGATRATMTLIDAEAVVQLVVRHGDRERAHRLRQQDLDQVDAAVGEAACRCRSRCSKSVPPMVIENFAPWSATSVSRKASALNFGQAADLPVHAVGVVAVEPVRAAARCRSGSSAAGCRCAPRATVPPLMVSPAWPCAAGAGEACPRSSPGCWCRWCRSRR